MYDKQVISLDIFVTAAAAARVGLPADKEYDGVAIVPYLLGKKRGQPHQQLFWRVNSGFAYAVRENRYKLVGSVITKKNELFDLESDSLEARDISKENPKEVQRLKQAYDMWQSKMIAPLWQDPLDYFPNDNRSK